MYLHCCHGFVEADAWDGQPIPLKVHQEVATKLGADGGSVVVVRARRADTLRELIAHLPRSRADGVMPKIVVYKSPPDWDYEFRVYLTAVEWGSCMTRVALGLDYRNFKHTAQAGHGVNRREYPLAMAIWNAAYEHVTRGEE